MNTLRAGSSRQRTLLQKAALQKHIDTDRSGPPRLACCLGRADTPSALPSPGVRHPSQRVEGLRKTECTKIFPGLTAQQRNSTVSVRNNSFMFSWKFSKYRISSHLDPPDKHIMNVTSNRSFQIPNTGLGELNLSANFDIQNLILKQSVVGREVFWKTFR